MLSESLFLSSSRSAIQLFLNLENFSEQLSSCLLQANRFVSDFKVITTQSNLPSFLQQDFSNLCKILPTNLQSPKSKPSEVIKLIIQEFKDSPKIFSNLSTSKNFIKLRASRISQTPISEFFQINSKNCAFIDIVWDVNPTAALVVDIFERLGKVGTLEVLGLVCARGFYYCSGVKSGDDWKVFEDCRASRVCGFDGLVAFLVSSFVRPVMLFVKQGTGFSQRMKEVDRIREFALMQDSVLGNSLKDDWLDCEVYDNCEGLGGIYGLGENRRNGDCRDFYSKVEKAVGLDRKDDIGGQIGFGNSKGRNKSFESVDLNREIGRGDERKDKVLKSYESNFSAGKFSGTDPRMFKSNYSCFYKNESIEGFKGNYSSSNPNFAGRFEKGDESRDYFKNRTVPPAFNIDGTNTGQMPEIKIANLQDQRKTINNSKSLTKESFYTPSDLKFQEKKNLEKLYSNFSQNIKNQNFYQENNHIQSISRVRKDSNYLPENKYSKNHLDSSYSEKGLKECLDRWNCPKCSTSNTENIYECFSCKFINWDMFYSIKSSSKTMRSGSIPSRAKDKYSLKYKTSNEDSQGNYWHLSNRYTQGSYCGKN